MKKVTALLTALLLLLPLCACDRTYRDSVEDGPFGIMTGSYFPFPSPRNPGGACVNRYTWDGDPQHTDVVIPDEYGSLKVRKLGGYYGKGLPAPFWIDDTSWMGLHDDNEDIHDLGCLAVSYDMFDEYADECSEIVYHDFHLHIGKNIDEIYSDVCATLCTINGLKTAYCPRVTVTCDEENETFYAENGRLYVRETGELVPGFIYAK